MILEILFSSSLFNNSIIFTAKLNVLSFKSYNLSLSFLSFILNYFAQRAQLRLVSPIRNIQGQTIFPGKKPGFTRLRLQQTFCSAGHEQVHRLSSVDPVNVDGFILFPGDPNQFMGKCRSDHIDAGKIKFHFFFTS